MLLDGVNHIAWLSKDVARLGRFYAEVFDAEVGPTRSHGQEPGETMSLFQPASELDWSLFGVRLQTWVKPLVDG